jgi:hypothetical protein
MRTTIDLPDDSYRRLKAKAALEGISLKEILTRSVDRELNETPKRGRLTPPLIRGKGKRKINPTREQLDEAMFG